MPCGVVHFRICHENIHGLQGLVVMLCESYPETTTRIATVEFCPLKTSISKVRFVSVRTHCALGGSCLHQQVASDSGTMHFGIVRRSNPQDRIDVEKRLQRRFAIRE